MALIIKNFSDYSKVAITDAKKILCESGTPDVNAYTDGAEIKTYLDGEGYMNDSDFTNDESLMWKNDSSTVENKRFYEIDTIFPKYHIHNEGFTFSVNGGNKELEVPGTDLVCRDSSNTYNILVAGNYEKIISSPFSAGDGNGSLDTGTFSENRVYFIWAIYNVSTEASDILTSLDDVSPTMPSGYGYSRLVGAVYFIDYVTNQFAQWYWNDIDEEKKFKLKLTDDYINPQISIKYFIGSTFTLNNVQCLDSTNEYEINMPQLITKNMSTSWTAGNSTGALDAGSIADDTLYYIYAIRDNDNGAVDILSSLSATSPTMPSGYDVKRHIGYILTADYSGNTEFWVWSVYDTLYMEMDGTSATKDITLGAINSINNKQRYIIKCTNASNACTLVSADGFDSSISSPITLAANEVIEVMASNDDSEYKIINKQVIS